ncbi:transglycosylase SLT domain-containing protein [Acetobacter sp. LMG 1627]|uniref:Transglycosylase SLT domain-containing protein n=2 Tax=Acetobacter conturbans TaxID=1737472 RepID=A0ABX0K7P3_9PROT|nr:transglycosylase SLT domain-containing protein [Acetobacter conturbans]
MRPPARFRQRHGDGRALVRPVLFCLWSAGIGLVLVLAPCSSHAQPIDGLIREAARQVALPPEWIHGVLQVESGGDPHAMSAKGAMGLMQIMPATWQELRRDLNLGADPFDPHDNVLAGATYLRLLHDRYGDAGFLAAYNAGPGRYEAHLSTGRPLPHETRDYVASVVRLLDRHMSFVDALQDGDVSDARVQPEDTLFAGHVRWQSSVDRLRVSDTASLTSKALFVPVAGELLP